MNSISGPVPPKPTTPPPHVASPSCCQPVPFQPKNGAIRLESLVAASVDAATGIALSRVTTNSQATASYGGLAVNVKGNGCPFGQSVSYGWKICTPASPAGMSTRTCASRNVPSELRDTEHRAFIGGALPLGGSICPSTATPGA